MKLTKLFNQIKYNNRKRKQIALNHTERFSARLYSLIKSQNFDVILAPGNSGLFMGEIAKMVYEESGVDLPEYHVIPVYRDGSDYTDSVKLKSKNISEVLIIDDEIMTGTSAKMCIQSLLRAFPESSHINVTIVAENMNFEWHHKTPGVSVYFYPYARSISGLGNNISFILDKRDFNKLSKYIPIHKERKQVLAIVLSGMVKTKDNDGKWIFDKTVEGKIAHRTLEYMKIKRQIISDISVAVKTGIQKRKDKKIKFVGD